MLVRIIHQHDFVYKSGQKKRNTCMIKSPQLNKEVFLMNYYTKKLGSIINRVGGNNPPTRFCI
ncbi:hypothetical protein H1220_02125 [Carnobacteriaceae bacterium zg-84]|nr:hypothetical protein H1220_02125 [Carnobacteriaceae bacterium zg-84]